MSGHKILVADGLDAALVGFDDAQQRAVYSKNKIVGILMERDGMAWEAAVEFMDFNVTGAYLGEGTPIFMDEMDREELDEYCDHID